MRVTDTIKIKGQKWHDFLAHLCEEFEAHQNAELALTWAHRAVCPGIDLIVRNLPGIYIIGNEYEQETGCLKERCIGRLIRIRNDTVYFFPGEALHFSGDKMSTAFCGIAAWSQQYMMVFGDEIKVACYALNYRGEYIFYYVHGTSYEGNEEKFLLDKSMFNKIRDFFNINQ